MKYFLYISSRKVSTKIRNMNRLLSYLISLMMCLLAGACMPHDGGRQQNAPESGGIIVLGNPDDDGGAGLDEGGLYTDKDRVALYIHTYGHLPGNFITKREAQDLGWESSRGNLDKVAPGKSIGGDKFGNYEQQLPKAKGRKYFECDIDYAGGQRNAKRIVYSSDGLIYYTGNHYKTFQQLY